MLWWSNLIFGKSFKLDFSKIKYSLPQQFPNGILNFGSLLQGDAALSFWQFYCQTSEGIVHCEVFMLKYFKYIPIKKLNWFVTWKKPIFSPNIFIAVELLTNGLFWWKILKTGSDKIFYWLGIRYSFLLPLYYVKKTQKFVIF